MLGGYSIVMNRLTYFSKEKNPCSTEGSINFVAKQIWAKTLMQKTLKLLDLDLLLGNNRSLCQKEKKSIFVSKWASPYGQLT